MSLNKISTIEKPGTDYHQERNYIEDTSRLKDKQYKKLN